MKLIASVLVMAAGLAAGGQTARFDCVDGIYPHLAMQNDEGECGTGAVVPWAGSLWVVTYGPHCPVGSSDKLYQIKPDLTRVIRAESVGGTPANRMIHRESNQLFIGPYAIDAKGNVRVIDPKRMPGRLTATARHTSDAANKIFTATMDNGLYEVDVKTLAVKTLVRDDNGVDGAIWQQKAMSNFPYPSDWYEAIPNKLPGSHTKGMATGFGKVFVANNGEYDPRSRTDPWIPSGVLGSYDPVTRQQRVIRRCQFTDVTTPDGIYGNEHPQTNPIWSLGWDVKSVILAVTTNGAAWCFYRLPKASHAYDGAHGWNTEWPRIREAGLGDGNLLATMHGTFWRFPKSFAPATPNGIRPLSTYLKVIGDFCYWKDAPGGGSIVFGCDDHAKNQFMGTRKLKADQPPNQRSTSNLWFVKPEELTTFGPPTGEGWVWLNEDVKAGDVSDPYLWEGYAEREFTCVDRDGRPVAHELVHEGDWVRVKALAEAKGVKAHFVYGPQRPARPAGLLPTIAITDENGQVFRFPSVNGDTNVICREVVTERDLLYAGGVFYEVPAANAGGFAQLRPIALAEEPVRSIAVDRGLIVVNGKRRSLDSLWRNGTAAEAYWLWRRHSTRGVLCLTFDDAGFVGWTNAIPLFAKYDAHATFFAIGHFGTNQLAALKALSAAGHSLGLHSLQHRDAPAFFTNRCALAYLREQIDPQLADCAKAGLRPRFFAYPNNRHNDATDEFLSHTFTRFRVGAKIGWRTGYYAPAGKKSIVEYDAAFFPVRDLPKNRLMGGVGVGEYYYTDIEDICRGIRRAAERDEVFVLFSHCIEPNARGVSMKTVWLERILQAARENKISIRSFDELGPVE